MSASHDDDSIIRFAAFLGIADPAHVADLIDGPMPVTTGFANHAPARRQRRTITVAVERHVVGKRKPDRYTVSSTRFAKR